MNTIFPRIRLKNARNWAPSSPQRWLWAFTVFLFALCVRLLLHEQLGHRFPLVFFTVATLVVHFFLGLGPALLVAVVSLPVAVYAFVPPYMSFDMPSTDDLFLVVYYVASTVLFMVLVQYLRRAQYQAVLLSEIAESRYLMLLDSEADRRAIEATSASVEKAGS